MVAIDPFIRDAIVFASLLSVLSLGLTLTYLVTKVPNFAHGSMATIGIYVTLTATELWRVNPYLSLPLSFLLGGGASLLLYFGAIRPLIVRGAGIVALMVSTIAYELILISALNIYADYLNRTYFIQTRDFLLRKYDVRLLASPGFEGLPGVFIVSPVLVVALVVSLYIFLTRTRFGVAMRAAIENEALAGVLGINVKRVYIVSWLLAGGLAGVAGGLLGLWFQANPIFGSSQLVSIFAASIVGGLTNIYGGVLGGILVGLTQKMGIDWLRRQLGSWVLAYEPLIPLLAMVATLLVLPRGLTGVDWRWKLARLLGAQPRVKTVG